MPDSVLGLVAVAPPRRLRAVQRRAERVGVLCKVVLIVEFWRCDLELEPETGRGEAAGLFRGSELAPGGLLGRGRRRHEGLAEVERPGRGGRSAGLEVSKGRLLLPLLRWPLLLNSHPPLLDRGGGGGLHLHLLGGSGGHLVLLLCRLCLLAQFPVVVRPMVTGSVVHIRPRVVRVAARPHTNTEL